MFTEISFEGIGQKTSATFLQSGLTKADNGKTVKISADKTVELCADGDKIAGIIDSVEPGAVSVKLDGFFTLPYTGTAPGLGYEKLSGNGSGGVKVDASGMDVRVVSVNTTSSEVTFLL